MNNNTSNKQNETAVYNCGCKTKSEGLSSETVKLSLKNQFMIVLIWIGLWGSFDTIISMYVSDNNYRLRLFIYFCTIFIALFFLY